VQNLVGLTNGTETATCTGSASLTVNDNNPTQAQNVNAPGVGYAGNVGARDVAAQQIGGSSLLQGNINQYMNPYTTGVIDQTISDLDRARQIGDVNIAAAATGSGSFGGDRQALLNSENQRNYLDTVARTSANLRNQGFTQASQMLESDTQRRQQASLANQGAGLTAGMANQGAGLQAGLANQGTLQNVYNLGSQQALQAGMANQGAGLQAGMANQGALNQSNQYNAGLGLQAGLANQSAGLTAGLANQSAGLQGARLRGQAAGQLAGIGGALQDRTLTAANALNQMGAQDQMLAQGMTDADIAQFYEARNDPTRGFGLLQGILQGMPVGMTQTQYQPRNNWGGAAQGALGGAGTGAAIGSVIPGFGTALGAGIGGLLGGFGGYFG